MKPLAYIGCAFLLIACHSETGSNGEPSNDSLTAIDSAIVDTAAIEKKIHDLYQKELSYYDSARDQSKVYTEYSGDIECKLNLNGDQWLDYYVIEFTIGGGPTTGVFYDGKTGELIDYTDGTVVIWSRPGVDIEYEVIDVDCDDSQQEMLIRYGSGGNAGCYYDCQVYRYDPGMKKIKLIFQETISSYTIGFGVVPDLNETRYVDINYNNDSCISEIRVQAGVFAEEGECYSLDVKPDKKATSYRYIFDKTKNEFMLKDSAADNANTGVKK